MTTFLAPPLDPMRIVFDSPAATVSPTGPVLTRRMSSLEGLFEAEDLRRELAEQDDPIVYTVASSRCRSCPASCRSRSPRSRRAPWVASST